MMGEMALYQDVANGTIRSTNASVTRKEKLLIAQELSCLER